jgi:pimeloyl-ACP methyl ester carboxylesterase
VTREIEANGFRFTCLETGVGGEPVLLLHGFPETSAMWTQLTATLAVAGYHCLAPDQRGYSRGARLEAEHEYRYEYLAADILAIAKAAGFDRYHVVAHDWGACAAWAALSVDRVPVISYVSMSIPHYSAFARAVWDDPDEELYRGFLEFFTAAEHAAEAAMSADDFDLLRSTAWTAHDADEVDAYLSVFRQPGALTGALNWYRASLGHRRALEDRSFEFRPINTPTLLLWGRDDPYARRMSVESAADYMKGPYEVIELDAGHWLVQEQPDAVADEVLRHLADHSRRRCFDTASRGTYGAPRVSTAVRRIDADGS